MNALSPESKRWIAHLDPAENYSLELIQNACYFAFIHEKEAGTPFSLSTLTQGLAMAEVLLPLHCDSETLAAAIIYPTLFFNQKLLSALHEQFDKPICKMISGAMQMESIHQMRADKNRLTAQQNQIDNLRKMMLAMVDDIRTVLLKLSERLVMLQHLNRSAPEIQKKIAQETMDYYAPLANRLGIHHLKWQLEDWAFRYLNSEEYQHISKAFHLRHKDRVRLIHQMIAELKLILAAGELHSTKISGRIKHIYSIYRKIQRKKVSFEKIYDSSAVRILVPTITDCYAALSLVHNQWEPITSEFDDYIAKPKANGYQSIHTAVVLPDHTYVEIQFRTFEMHEKAELGIAAHWRYKENKTVAEAEDQKINLLRELLDWQKGIEKKDAQSALYRAAFKDRVYVFSPTGDVYDLKNDATPLDFAYLIHSELGHRCRGAKINGALVPLTQPLKTGDRIEIITIKKSQPSHDWIRADLGYLKTQHAIRKVKQWFKKQDYDKNHSDGKILWEKITRQHNVHKIDLQLFAESFHHKTPDALFVALGAGDIAVTRILSKLVNQQKEKIAPDDLTHIADSETKTQSSSTDFSVQGTKHLLTQVAQCCHPIPGDSIIGYITKGRGISVHQKKCRNIEFVLKNKAERLIEISWESNQEKSYRVNLNIQAEDRAGLLRDISGLIAQLNLSIYAMQSRLNSQNNMANIQLTIDVRNIESLDMIFRKVRKIRGVMAVARE